MSLHDFAAFEQFVQHRRKNLRFIAGETRGEYQFDDAVNEAYVLAAKLAAHRNFTVDFRDAAFQDYLLACLYNHLVEFQEKKIRNGLRLNHGADNSDGNSSPLLNKFAIDERLEPESIILRAEAESHTDDQLSTHPSLAAAYLRLLEHFNYRMQAVADHLLISVSHAYRCCADARCLETAQRHFFWPAEGELPLPRPWRRFKIHRPRQLGNDLSSVITDNGETYPTPTCQITPTRS